MWDDPSIARLLAPPDRSFFLFGPRGTGKSTWLRGSFGSGAYVDLLDASLYLELVRDPHALESIVGNRPAGTWIVLDEIQKVPAILDEVHRLMETRRWRFALCGSSARKLRRPGVDLLGGRAISLGMAPLSGAEIGEGLDLRFSLERGMLPFVQTDRSNAEAILGAYVSTYLKEEIREEGIVRRVPPFVRFLAVAGVLNGQILESSNVARDAAVPRSTVDTYFSILEDTLVGHMLPAWQPGLKVRERGRPKFYWFDPGVARAAAGLHHDPPDRSWLGFALETLVFHELRVRNEVSGRHRPVSHYRTAAGVDIDFIVETRMGRPGSPARLVCIEVKLASRWDPGWETAMRSLAAMPGVKVERMIGVYTGPRALARDRVDVLPYGEFLRRLHAGEIF